jgi:disulfide bond formation protein DsbB
MSVTGTTDSIAPLALRERAKAAGWAWAALAVALAGLAGSLALTWGMGLKACPLCFYQRTFMMSLVAVLGMGLIARAVGPDRLGFLALPLATAGLGVALFHVSLEVRGRLECPQGLLGLGTAPQQSLAVFVVLFALLVIDVLRGLPQGAATWGALAGAVVLGGLLAAASSTSNPPMQRPTPETYARPPDVCRPPQGP